MSNPGRHSPPNALNNIYTISRISHSLKNVHHLIYCYYCYLLCLLLSKKKLRRRLINQSGKESLDGVLKQQNQQRYIRRKAELSPCSLQLSAHMFKFIAHPSKIVSVSFVYVVGVDGYLQAVGKKLNYKKIVTRGFV